MKYRVCLMLEGEATLYPCFDFDDLTEALCFINFALKQGYEAIEIRTSEVREDG